MSSELVKLEELFNQGSFRKVIGQGNDVLEIPTKAIIAPRIQLLMANAVFEEALQDNCSYEIIHRGYRICETLYRYRRKYSVSFNNNVRTLAPRLASIMGYEGYPIAAAREVAELLPKNPLAIYSLGWILAREKRDKEALAVLLAAWDNVKPKPNPLLAGRIQFCAAGIAYNVANMELAEELCDNAKMYFKRVACPLRVGPDIQRVDDLMELIKSMH